MTLTRVKTLVELVDALIERTPKAHATLLADLLTAREQALYTPGEKWQEFRDVLGSILGLRLPRGTHTGDVPDWALAMHQVLIDDAELRASLRDASDAVAAPGVGVVDQVGIGGLAGGVGGPAQVQQGEVGAAGPLDHPLGGVVAHEPAGHAVGQSLVPPGVAADAFAQAAGGTGRDGPDAGLDFAESLVGHGGDGVAPAAGGNSAGRDAREIGELNNEQTALDAIRAKCCCKHDDARQCLLMRHPEICRVCDDPDSDYDRFIDEVCECACHREIRELDGPEDWEIRP